MKPKQKWKPFSQKQIILLEKSYKKYLESRDFSWIKAKIMIILRYTKFVFLFMYYVAVVVVNKISLSK